jgi:pyruvate formate lyase activating enzyme
MKIHRKLCTSCGVCVEACPNQAFELVGTHMTVEELRNEVKRDSQYFRRSNGGVTVGGGEPAMQHEFVVEFLKSLRQLYIHTAIETCGYVHRERLEMLLQHVDLVYFDLKHMDTLAHKKLTRVSNKRILASVYT